MSGDATDRTYLNTTVKCLVSKYEDSIVNKARYGYSRYELVGKIPRGKKVRDEIKQYFKWNGVVVKYHWIMNYTSFDWGCK